MDFRITGLTPDPFVPFYGLTDAQLSALGVQRLDVDGCPGYPDRIELRDAQPGETVLLLNHVHLDAASPYRASHAIFVREGARSRYDRINEVPPCLRPRVLSLRAYDAQNRMVDADLVDGRGVEALIERLLGHPEAAFIHAHYAKRGCYAARIDRVA